jgi:serine/threonine protein kinase
MPLNSVDERLIIFNKINGYIDKYLEEDKDPSKCLNKRNNELNFSGRIFLDTLLKISSLSGSIYISHIEDDKDCKFITKVQLKDSDSEANNELYFLNLIKNKLILENEKYKTFNIHLPLLYNNLECINYNPDDNIITIKEGSELSSLNYYSTFVEKADGSLDDFIKYIKFSEEQLFNIIAQCFIGIFSCHKLNIFHRDTHTGNFLFYKIKYNDDEYFEYKLISKNKSYKMLYLKNIGYNFFVWDFGKSQKINKNNKQFTYNDYITLIMSVFDTLMSYNKSLNNSQVLYHLGVCINYYIRKNNIFQIMYDVFRNKYEFDFIHEILPDNAKIVKSISLYI